MAQRSALTPACCACRWRCEVWDEQLGKECWDVYCAAVEAHMFEALPDIFAVSGWPLLLCMLRECGSDVQ